MGRQYPDHLHSAKPTYHDFLSHFGLKEYKQSSNVARMIYSQCIKCSYLSRDVDLIWEHQGSFGMGFCGVVLEETLIELMYWSVQKPRNWVRTIQILPNNASATFQESLPKFKVQTLRAFLCRFILRSLFRTKSASPSNSDT
jgi:hypothetical protein